MTLCGSWTLAVNILMAKVVLGEFPPALSVFLEFPEFVLGESYCDSTYFYLQHCVTTLCLIFFIFFYCDSTYSICNIALPHCAGERTSRLDCISVAIIMTGISLTVAASQTEHQVYYYRYTSIERILYTLGSRYTAIERIL